MYCVRGAVLAAVLGSAIFAQEPPPGPACTKETQGRLWPLEANADRQIARRLIQAGELYVCRAGARTFRWELLAVNINALEAAHPRKKAAPASEEPAPRVRLARR